MDEEEIRNWIERLLDELAGIRTELDGLEAPAPDPTPVLVLAVLASVLAIAALVAAAVALRASRRGVVAQPVVDPHREDRAAFAADLRRYSEVLGVEAVSGRAPTGTEPPDALRTRLESRAVELGTPGALDVVDEVASSRRSLADLPQAVRAASSGLAGMTVEWSIDRWLHDPDGWLRDHRERARLQALGRRAAMAPPSSESEEADTRRR